MNEIKPTWGELQAALEKAGVKNFGLVGIESAMKIFASITFAEKIAEFTEAMVQLAESGSECDRSEIIKQLTNIDQNSVALAASHGVTRRDMALFLNGGQEPEKKTRKRKKQKENENEPEPEDAGKEE